VLAIRAREDRNGAAATRRSSAHFTDLPTRAVILVACSKCEWKAAYQRAELIASHGVDCPMPSLLERLAAPSCARVGQQWDRCGAHYVEPIEDLRDS
jgi:hypothetical protein